MRTSTRATVLSSLLLVALAAPCVAASSEADFKAAYAAAEAANKQAGLLRNQWTTTAATLATAKKAAEAGDFEHAIALSREAEALAKASVYQATSEKEAWKALEIR
jgi:excinuclease UvrABC nuclease subunit